MNPKNDFLSYTEKLPSQNLYDLIKNHIKNYDNEDDLYYKPRDVSDWFNEWDFKNFNPNIYSHGFHQYPAKFIPQLARKLLRIFTDEKSIILDIFVGSGTTLIESMLLNRKKAIGIELNPFACFMANVKTNPISPIELEKAFKSIKNEYYTIKKCKIHYFYNIDFWFKEKQIQELSKLRYVILNLPNESIKNFFLLCMSEVIRRVSLTNHNGFKLHRNKEKLKENFDPDVFTLFEFFTKRNITLMEEFYNNVKEHKTDIKIIQGNATKIQDIEPNSCDFILTSPPYGDSKTTVAYGQFSRLSWQWIRNDKKIHKLDEELLGGRIYSNESIKEILDISPTLKLQYNQIKNQDIKRAKEIGSFFYDLFLAIKNASLYLKKNKYFVLVIGNRTVKNISLRTDLIVSEIAFSLGLNTEKIFYRNIINKRMPKKNSPTNIKGQVGHTILKESIIFLKKV